MKQITCCLFFATALVLFGSCSGELNSGNAHRGAIVLGDSSTIVTEADTTYLSDQVADIEPQAEGKPVSASAPDTEKKAEVSQPTPDNTTPKTAEANAAAVNGFTIDFGQGVKVSFPGITARSYQQQNPEKESGVSYAVTSGNLSKSNLVVTGLKNITVRQRYQSYLELQSGKEKLSLKNLGSYLSDWESLSGNSTSFSLKLLQNIGYKSISQNTLRNGLRSAARSERLSRSETNFWINAIRRTRSAKDAPCRVEMDNVQWQISGETASGRRFHKTIRLES